MNLLRFFGQNRGAHVHMVVYFCAKFGLNRISQFKAFQGQDGGYKKEECSNRNKDNMFPKFELQDVFFR